MKKKQTVCRDQPEFMFVFDSKGTTTQETAIQETVGPNESSGDEPACHLTLSEEDATEARQKLIAELHELGC